jgi:hypothetical protein
MKLQRRHIGFWISLLLVLAVVPYTIIEWFDQTIPFSNNLFILSGCAMAIFVVNLFYLKKRR